MSNVQLKCVVGPVVAALSACASGVVQADFTDDSHLSMGLRNFYVDRDYKQENAAKSRTGSWSQGFDLQFISGYTEGPVQFGLDLDGQFAYRLDGSKARSPDGALPVQTDGSPVRDYGHSAATAKVRFSKTELKIGDQRPNLPVAQYDPTRQLVTSYTGALLESRRSKI